MTETTLSGEELEKALLEGDLAQAQVQLTGMVKPSETEGYISFSQSGCEAWVDVPTSLIEKADHVGHTPCRDHVHPLMEIALKEPEDREAKALQALLAQQSQSLPPPSVPEQTESQFLRTGATGPNVPQQSVIPQHAPLLSGSVTGAVEPGGRTIDTSNPCCCTYRTTICRGGYCWPATYQVCISCPAWAHCECSATGPYCSRGPLV